MHRLFVAIRPPAEVRAIVEETMSGVPGARWQDDAQLHLTLRYIGEVERPVAEDVAVALSGVAAAAPHFAVAGVGRFERRGRTDTLWAAVAPPDALAALHRKIDRALIDLGLDAEHRAYLPHITVARLALGASAEIAVARWLADHAALTSPAFEPSHLILYESHLTKGGAHYEAIARWPFDRKPLRATGPL